jgi:hypothetical protein
MGQPDGEVGDRDRGDGDKGDGDKAIAQGLKWGGTA